MVAPKAKGGIRRGGSDIKAAVEKIKRSPKAVAELKRQAILLSDRANRTIKQKQAYPDYFSALHAGDGNVEPKATVYTRSNHAKYHNSRHNTLVKLL